LNFLKKEFVTFGDILDKTHKKLEEAASTIEKASSKSRTIERKLGKVQELPSMETTDVIPLQIEE
jgi:DNA recombination protein RmuC